MAATRYLLELESIDCERHGIFGGVRGAGVDTAYGEGVSIQLQCVKLELMYVQ
jgi:hypothetical protein